MSKLDSYSVVNALQSIHTVRAPRLPEAGDVVVVTYQCTFQY